MGTHQRTSGFFPRDVVLTCGISPAWICDATPIAQHVARLGHDVLPREVCGVCCETCVRAGWYPLFLIPVVLDEVNRVARVGYGEVSPGDIVDIAGRSYGSLETRTDERVVDRGVLKQIVTTSTR